jgi:hypothetical protein
MSLTVELSPDLERLLEEEARRTGTSPASVAREVLRKSLVPGLTTSGSSAPRLSPEESRLLAEINNGPSTAEMERYLALVKRRQSESLADSEMEELRGFTNRMERLAVTRMRALVALAALRGMEVEALMEELQLGKHPPDDEFDGMDR